MIESNAPPLAGSPALPDLSSLWPAITEHAPLPMAAVAGAGHIVRHVNPAFCRLMGKREADLVGKTFAELLPAGDECAPLIDGVFRTGEPASYARTQHAEAHPLFWSCTMWPVVAMQQTVGVVVQVTETAAFHERTLAMNQALLVGSVRQHELTAAADAANARLLEEISERNRAEEQLQRAQAEARAAGERFHLIAESLPQKIFTAVPSGDIDYFNRQWTEYTGLSAAQIRESGLAPCIHPDDLDENLRVWRHSIETGEPLHFEHRIRGADGGYRWHISRALALKDGDGTILMWLGSSTDIHEIKEADERKNEFLAMLAHELRNPLAPIRYMLEIMKRADGDATLISPALGTIERQVRQMTRLIDDLLDVSRISRGKLLLRREEVELAANIRDVVEAGRPACEAARHNLTVLLPTHPIYVYADPVRLTQLFGNLLHNACKFTPPGGSVSLAAERQGDDVVITVKDSGIGIPADMLPRIFELFAQGDQSLVRGQGGLGIGLTLVRQLVHLHGGTVEAFSDGVGLGSEFVVRLPAMIRKQQAPSADLPDGTPPDVPARRILVVDDSHDAADALAMLLQLTGNETRLAYDGEEAVEAAAAWKPDVVLLDIGMPKLNGYEAARRIRAEPWGRNMVLLALTGWGQDEDRKRTAEAGFDGHLVKPVDYGALVALLANFPTTRRWR